MSEHTPDPLVAANVARIYGTGADSVSSEYTPTLDEVRYEYARAQMAQPFYDPRWEGERKQAEAAFDRALAARDAQVRAETIAEFGDLYFGPGVQTRTWVANTMRKRHGLPPRSEGADDE